MRDSSHISPLKSNPPVTSAMEEGEPHNLEMLDEAMAAEDVEDRTAHIVEQKDTDNDNVSLLQPNSKSMSSSTFSITRDRVGYQFVGIKTVLAALFLFFCGLMFFIAGNVIYWHSEEARGMSMIIVGSRFGCERYVHIPSIFLYTLYTLIYPLGMSMIIVGAVMLIPGTYGMMVVYGSFRGWRGYDRESIDGAS